MIPFVFSLHSVCVCCYFVLICIISFLNSAFPICSFCCYVLVCIICFFSSTLSLVMICIIPLSLSRFFCRWLNLFPLSGIVSILIEVKLCSDLMTSSEVCFVWFSLFLFVTVVSFLFHSGILLLIHHKSFPSPFVFLLHVHTFLLLLLFLLSSSDTETWNYFQMFDVGLACICIVVLLGILLKLVLLWCFHIWSETICGNTHTVLLF